MYIGHDLVNRRVLSFVGEIPRYRNDLLLSLVRHHTATDVTASVVYSVILTMTSSHSLQNSPEKQKQNKTKQKRVKHTVIPNVTRNLLDSGYLCMSRNVINQ